MAEIVKFIEKISQREDLSEEESSRVFQIMLSGGATPSQISGFLIGLLTKGETEDEIAGAAKTMRHKMTKLNISESMRAKSMDVCGTGGDKKGTFNISTAVSFVVSSFGIPMIKHGNKAVSSKSGSADVLNELGINTILNPEQAITCLKEANIVFIMAPLYHQSLKSIGPIRQELGIRTIFNILGPLCNPAMPDNQLMGVYNKELVEPIAKVFKNLNLKRAMVVHGLDGIDELSVCEKSEVSELNNNKIINYQIDPEDYGIKIHSEENLKGGDARFNAEAMLEIFAGADNAYADAVILNSAAALYVSGACKNLNEGVKLSKKSLKNGNAKEALKKLVEVSNNI